MSEFDISKIDVMQPTVNEARRIVNQCKNVEDGTGFLFFVESIVIVEDSIKGSAKMSDSIYNWQREAAVEFLRNRNIISKKTRQVGFSTLTGAYALWRALFFNSQQIAIFSIGQRESTTLLRRIKFMYENLPPWLKQKTTEFAKTAVTFEHNNSRIISLPQGSDPGRGETLSLLIADEFATYRNSSDFLASANMTLSTGSRQSFTNEAIPSQFFVISTLPLAAEGNDYLRLYHNAVENPGSSKYKIIDVDTSDIPHYQIQDWHDEALETLGQTRYKLEVLGEEVYGIENAFLPQHILDGLQAIDPIRTDFLIPDDLDEQGHYKGDMLDLHDGFDEGANYIMGLWVWKDPLPMKEYGIAVDVSTGRSKDYSAFHIFDLENHEQVASYKGKINTPEFTKIIEIVIRYYNDAKLSIEMNGLGESICQHFGNTVNYENFYWTRRSKRNYVPGFYLSSGTGGSSRANVLASLETAMVNSEIVLKDARTIYELRMFGLGSRGRYEGIGANDDLVLSLAQYCYLREQFFSTSKQMESNLMFGEALEKIEAEQEEKRKRHYKNRYLNDASIVVHGEETVNLLELAAKAGYALPQMDKYIKDE